MIKTDKHEADYVRDKILTREAASNSVFENDGPFNLGLPIVPGHPDRSLIWSPNLGAITVTGQLIAETSKAGTLERITGRERMASTGQCSHGEPVWAVGNFRLAFCAIVTSRRQARQASRKVSDRQWWFL